MGRFGHQGRNYGIKHLLYMEQMCQRPWRSKRTTLEPPLWFHDWGCLSISKSESMDFGGHKLDCRYGCLALPISIGYRLLRSVKVLLLVLWHANRLFYHRSICCHRLLGKIWHHETRACLWKISTCWSLKKTVHQKFNPEILYWHIQIKNIYTRIKQ